MTVKPPSENYLRIIAGGLTALIISLVPAFGLASATFLLTASNRWVLETNWDTVNQISFEIWGASFLTPQRVGDLSFRLTPLLLTGLNLLVIHLATKHSGAKTWLHSGGVALSFAIAATILAAFKVQSADVAFLMVGIWLTALCGWVSTWRHWTKRPAWWQKLEFAKLAPQQFNYWLATLSVASLLALIAANYLAWDRVKGIHDLLNASTLDTVVIVCAQLLFLPNLLASVASWFSGAGTYTAADALQTPSQAIVAPIPAVPELGIAPQNPVGAWIILIPILVGLIGGCLLVWKQRSHSLRTQLTAYLVTAPALWVTLSFIFFNSTAQYGTGRLSLIGPNWLMGATFLTLELLIPGILVQAVLHRTTLEILQFVPARPQPQADTTPEPKTPDTPAVEETSDAETNPGQTTDAKTTNTETNAETLPETGIGERTDHDIENDGSVTTLLELTEENTNDTEPKA